MKDKHWFWFAICLQLSFFVVELLIDGSNQAHTAWLGIPIGMLAVRHLVYHIRIRQNLSVREFWSIEHPRHLLVIATLGIITSLVLRKLGNTQSMLVLYGCIALCVVAATISSAIRRQAPAA